MYIKIRVHLIYLHLNTMAFSIVEFEDGYFNLICTKWLHKEKDTLICFWPNMKTSEKYFRSVQKLIDLDEKKWEKVKVTQILGSYDSYNNARTKLKDAEIHTDICSDSELRGKGKRRRRTIRRYGFDTDVENDDYSSKRKIPKQTIHKEKSKLVISEPPKELMQFQCATSQKKEKDATKSYFYSKEQSVQKDVQVASTSRYDSTKKDKICDLTSELNDFEVEQRPAHTITSMNNSISTSRYQAKQTIHKEKSKLFIPEPPKELMQFQCATSQKKEKDATKSYFYSKEQSVQKDEQVASTSRYDSTKKHKICDLTSELNDFEVEQRPAYTITSMNNSVSTSRYQDSQEKDKIAASDSLSESEKSEKRDKFTKGRQGLQIQKLLQNDEYFKKFVISELLEISSQRKKLQYSLMKEHNQLCFDNLPYIDNVESLMQFDNKLKTNKVYREKVILLMSKIGGKNYKKVSMAILKRIIHCTLANKYSWNGGKGKMQFSIFKGLVNAVNCATRYTKHDGIACAADVTEEDIIGSIKEFLRQSIGRAKTWESKHQNERNQNLPGDISETEEVSSTINEIDEQSETSTDFENETDNVSDETDKNINIDDQNSDDEQ